MPKEFDSCEAKFEIDVNAPVSSAVTKNMFAKRLCDLLDENIKDESILSQEDLAGKIGVSASVISGYVTGNTEPKISNLVELAKVFKVSTDYLLGLTDVRSDDPTIQDNCNYVGLSDTALGILHENVSNQSDKLYTKVWSNLVERGFIDEMLKKIIDTTLSDESFDQIWDHTVKHIYFKDLKGKELKKKKQECEEEGRKITTFLEWSFGSYFIEAYKRIKEDIPKVAEIEFKSAQKIYLKERLRANDIGLKETQHNLDNIQENDSEAVENAE